MSASAYIEDDIRAAREFDPRISGPAQVALAAEPGVIATQIVMWNDLGPADSIDVKLVTL